MPRKSTIQKEELIECGLNLIRQEGWPSIGIRSLARAAGCSTQPVISHFPTLEALQKELWKAAERLQEQMLFDIQPDQDFLMQIGKNYIRFALEEPRLFQTVFDSDWNQPASLQNMLEDPALQPILSQIQAETALTRKQTLQMFGILSMLLHGYASLAASGQLQPDLKQFEADLVLLFDSLLSKLTSE